MDASGKPLRSRQLIERLGGRLGDAAVTATGAGAPQSFLARRQRRAQRIGDYARSLLGGRRQRVATSRLRREDPEAEEIRQRAPYRAIPPRPVSEGRSPLAGGSEASSTTRSIDSPRRRYDPYQ